MDEMDEIIEEFLVESHENLDRLDAEFVRLESDPDDVDVLAGIFRDIHTIKGTSGFLGYGKLEAVAHVGENLLSKLRDQVLTLNAERTSALLAMVDAIREILTHIEGDGTEGDGVYDPLVERLNAALVDTPAFDDDLEPTPTIGEILEQTAGVPHAAVEQAVAKQAAGDPRHIGELLIEQGTVKSEQVVEALNSQKAKKKADSARGAADATIRVDVDLLDELMNLVGELVLARNQIVQYVGRGTGILNDSTQRLNLITTELQEGVMKTRMQPIGNVFSKFPRVVRDISISLGKQVTVTMEGIETELDKTIIEAIKDPLTHMVRNSVDHGIETPEARSEAGKNPEGRLHLRAFHEGGQVNIEIEDDGAGINPEVIAIKAVEKGVVSRDQVQQMSDRQIVNLIFAPGFSTAETVSNISGRGVGMDVVRTSIERIGGSVDVVSTYGRGTVTKIKIPLTLAIIPAMIVVARGEQFAIPQVSLQELVRLEHYEIADAVEHIHGTPVYRLRGRLLPLLYLDEQLGFSGERVGSADGSFSIVVLQADEQQFGLVVDTIEDTAEIVVKPLGQILKPLQAYAGATIMGDGRVALILDVLGLASKAGLTNGQTTTAALEEQESVAADEQQMMLIFELGPREAVHRCAVPLEEVERLEELKVSDIEYAAGRPVIQYRGDVMALVWLADFIGTMRDHGADDADDHSSGEKMIQVLVYERGGRPIGFIVDRITDVVEEHLVISRPAMQLGLRGSAVIGGDVTDIVDSEGVIAAEAPDLLAEPATSTRTP